MASTKNNFLNAKPVSKMGGKSGGVRKPGKPYSKPPAKPKAENPARWDAKTKSERLQQAAKTKPKSAAPKQVITKPVTRSGPVKGPVPPKGSSSVSMPNSRRAGVNLPQAGARAERTATRVADLKKTSSAKAPAVKPSTVTSGAGLAGRMFGAATTALAIPAAIKNIADVAERNRQWDVYKERMGMNKPQAKPTPSSSAGRRTGSNNRVANLSVPTSSAGTRSGAAAGTRTRSRNTSASNSGPDWRSRVGSQDVATLRQGQNDAIRSYNKPPTARPSAARPSQTSPSSRTASGSGSPQRAAAANRAVPAGKQPSTSRDTFDRSGKGAVGPNYGIDQFGDKNGVDMERRRAFLDSKDSQSGRKAVNKLIEERRKKQRENDSTSK